MHIETLAVHAGHDVDAATGAVTPAIHLSTTFAREADGSYRAGFLYSRYANPNRVALETCLAQLEGGEVSAAFASGSAATMTLLQSLGGGAHAIVPDDAYFGTIKLARDVFGPWGLELSIVDMTDLNAVRAAVKPNTRLIWVETPSNPLLRVVDIAGVSAIARTAGALCAVDNTWGTPVLQRPLDLGADISMHSTTKYLGGHSDVLGGVLIFKNRDAAERIIAIQMAGGAVPSPFECWLVMRGIRTLPWRVRAQTESARQLAECLTKHPRVEVVHYPGLPTHPAHDIARRQMQGGFGGMLSVQVGRNREESIAIASRLKLFTQATSLGGTESLIEHRASVEGPGTRAPENLLRVSVGLEHPDDLIADFTAALSA